MQVGHTLTRYVTTNGQDAHGTHAMVKDQPSEARSNRQKAEYYLQQQQAKTKKYCSVAWSVQLNLMPASSAESLLWLVNSAVLREIG